MLTESGLLMVAEEFSLLAQKQVLKIAFALIKDGPLTMREIYRSDLGKPSRVGMFMRFLVNYGLVVEMKRRLPKREIAEPPRYVKQYFWADEHTGAAIREIVDVLERNHRAKAEALSTLAKGFDTQ